MRRFITQKTLFFYGYCNFIADKAQVEEALEEAGELTSHGFCFPPVYFTIKPDTDPEGGFWLSFFIAAKYELHKLAVNVWIASDLPADIRAVIDRFFKEYGFKNVSSCLYELFPPPKPLDDKGIESCPISDNSVVERIVNKERNMRRFITQKIPFFYGYCDFIADKAQVEDMLEEANALVSDGFCFLPVYFTIKPDTDPEGGFWLSFLSTTKYGLHKLAVNVWIISDLPANIRVVIDRFFKMYGFKNVCPCLYELFQPPKPLDDEGLKNSLPY